ncbi:MAG: hypothetical protein ACM359_22450 [Bacillota bacterium]
MCRLSDDDRRAIDILLDSRKATKAVENKNASSAQGGAQSTGPDAFDLRLAQVEQFLGLLQQLPADDPPRSLVHRTLQAVQVRRSSSLVSPGSGASGVTDLGAQI